MGVMREERRLRMFENRVLRRVFGPYGGNPRTCDSCSGIADSFQKLYERFQPCVVKDDDYFEGQ
jgi:hypothetical protein